MNQDLIIGLLTNFGLLAVCALNVTFAAILLPKRNSERGRMDGALGGILPGLVFGATCATMIVLSVELAGPTVGGALVDGRAAPAVLAGIFGGPVAAAVTAVMGGAARAWVGGPYALGGVFSMVIHSAVGLGYALVLRRYRHREIGYLDMVPLALLTSVAVMPTAFVNHDLATGLAVLRVAIPALIVQNLVSVVALGTALILTLSAVRDRIALVTLSENLEGAYARLDSYNSKLKTANRRLEDTVHELEHLVHAVAHDLRSPIITLRGYLDILRDARADNNEERERNAWKRITRSAEVMDSVVEIVLGFSKVQLSDLTFETVAVRPVFEDVARALGFDDGGPQARLVQAEPQLKCDRAMLHRMLLNLLDNTIKHSGRGRELQVLVSIDRRDSPLLEDTFVLSVADNGVGVPNELRQDAFRLFRRLSNVTAGNGIGLATVAKTARLHGGHAWIDESPLGGTCVNVAFAADSQDDPPDPNFEDQHSEPGP